MRHGNGAALLAVMLTSVSLLGASYTTTTVAARSPITRSAHTRPCRNTSMRPTLANTRLINTAVLCLTERERIHHRLPALQPNRELEILALNQVQDMVIGNYFDDQSSAGLTPWQRITTSPYASGARNLAAAQNIGWGTGVLATPAMMVKGWMHSPAHRRIMLTAGYHDIGVGVAPAPPHNLTNGLPGATYTVEFARRG